MPEVRLTTHPDAESATDQIDVSIVIPCLNEESTIVACVDASHKAIADAGVEGEVLVVDNGSTDASASLAAAAGARVIREDRPGYGSAYRAGLEAARGRAILMGDADTTYDFGELATFLGLLDAGADLVMGSRLRGTIHPGAMPALHRYIGNPLLTGMLNLLFRTSISDAHCGLRMVRASALPAMALRTDGMEFASEMVIKAKQSGLRIIETPIEYTPHPRMRTSKLHAVRDGFRHVRYMLAMGPAAWYIVPAIVLALTGAASLLGVVPFASNGVTGAALIAAAGLLTQVGCWLRTYGSIVIERRPHARLHVVASMARATAPAVTVALACAFAIRWVGWIGIGRIGGGRHSGGAVAAFGDPGQRLGSSMLAAALLLATAVAGALAMRRSHGSDERA